MHIKFPKLRKSSRLKKDLSSSSVKLTNTGSSNTSEESGFSFDTGNLVAWSATKSESEATKTEEPQICKNDDVATMRILKPTYATESVACNGETLFTARRAIDCMENYVDHVFGNEYRCAECHQRIQWNDARVVIADMQEDKYFHQECYALCHHQNISSKFGRTSSSSSGPKEEIETELISLSGSSLKSEVSNPNPDVKKSSKTTQSIFSLPRRHKRNKNQADATSTELNPPRNQNLNDSEEQCKSEESTGISPQKGASMDNVAAKSVDSSTSVNDSSKKPTNSQTLQNVQDMMETSSGVLDDCCSMVAKSIVSVTEFFSSAITMDQQCHVYPSWIDDWCGAQMGGENMHMVHCKDQVSPQEQPVAKAINLASNEEMERKICNQRMQEKRKLQSNTNGGSLGDDSWLTKQTNSFERREERKNANSVLQMFKQAGQSSSKAMGKTSLQRKIQKSLKTQETYQPAPVFFSAREEKELARAQVTKRSNFELRKKQKEEITRAHAELDALVLGQIETVERERLQSQKNGELIKGIFKKAIPVLTVENANTYINCAECKLPILWNDLHHRMVQDRNNKNVRFHKSCHDMRKQAEQQNIDLTKKTERHDSYSMKEGMYENGRRESPSDGLLAKPHLDRVGDRIPSSDSCRGSAHSERSRRMMQHEDKPMQQSLLRHISDIQKDVYAEKNASQTRNRSSPHWDHFRAIYPSSVSKNSSRRGSHSERLRQMMQHEGKAMHQLQVADKQQDVHAESKIASQRRNRSLVFHEVESPTVRVYGSKMGYPLANYKEFVVGEKIQPLPSHDFMDVAAQQCNPISTRYQTKTRRTGYCGSAAAAYEPRLWDHESYDLMDVAAAPCNPISMSYEKPPCDMGYSSRYAFEPRMKNVRIVSE